MLVWVPVLFHFKIQGLELKHGSLDSDFLA